MVAVEFILRQKRRVEKNGNGRNEKNSPTDSWEYVRDRVLPLGSGRAIRNASEGVPEVSLRAGARRGNGKEITFFGIYPLDLNQRADNIKN